MLLAGVGHRKALSLLYKLGRAEAVVDAGEAPLILLGPGGEYRTSYASVGRAGRGLVYLALGLFFIAAWAVTWWAVIRR